MNPYDSSPAFLFSFSQEEELITRINESFINRLGYTREELVNTKKFSSLLTVGSKIFFQTHFFPLLKLHGTFNEIFLSFLSKSNEELPLLLNASLNEQTREFHCGGIPIDQRNRFEKELLEAKQVAEQTLLENETLNKYRTQLESNQKTLERRLQELSEKNNEHQQINAIISHDLQEPLRKVCMFSDKLLTEEGPVLSQHNKIYLEKINHSADKMRELIIGLQKFLSLNDFNEKLVPVPLHIAFEDAWLKSKIQPAQESIVRMVGQMPAILGNYELIVNLFKELLSNSLKFKDPTKPQLKITVTSDLVTQNIFRELEDKYQYEEYVRIIYSDNGIGFNNAFADQIFSVFRKAHNNANVGIGLSHCKKIVKLHHGFITAEGVPGKGSSFTLLFPALQA